jgi:ATP phosphoribosyltransferase
MKPLRIALTKGRLEKDSIALLERVGYECSSVRNKGRRLIFPAGGNRLELVLAKAADVITYVDQGVCDLGVVGKDTILEKGGIFYEVLDLGFGKCRFALAGPKGRDFFGGYSSRIIASKYPNFSASYFEKKAMDVRIIKIEGSVELAPLLGLADAIVDLVETGTTLRENGLEVIEYICDISARLIVNTASMKLRKKEIDELIGKLEQAVSRPEKAEEDVP